MTLRATALLGLFVGFATLHTWPLASDLAGLSRLDNDDTGLNTWIVAWVAHVLPRDPLGLFDAPMFHPEGHTLAYSEHLLVPALMGAPLLWLGLPAVTVYNLLVLAGFALSGWAMCLVIWGWTGSAGAGVVSGLLFAFNAHLLTRLPHLQALHVEFLPLALYVFDRLLAGPLAPRATGLPPLGPAVTLAAAFVAQALCSNYTLVFLTGALLAAALVRAPEWLAPPRRPVMAALVVAGGLSALALAPFLWPYYVVRRDLGLERSIEDVGVHAARWLDYLSTAGRVHYDWWSHRWFDGRTALFPGVTATLLALACLCRAASWRDPRVRMVVAIGVLGVALSLGPALPGYGWLHAHVPLLQGIRGAARWGFLALVSVAVLAGFEVAALGRRWRSSPYRAAALVLLIGLVTLEALRAPMSLTPVPPVPPLYRTLAAGHGAVVEFPLYAGPRVSENARYLVYATTHFRPLVNGYSGFESDAARARAERWRAFPGGEVLDEMRALGVTHVVVHLADVPEAQAAAAAASPRLQLEVDDGERRLYRLRS